MKNWFKNFKNEDGFTLIEMTIVVMVIAILLIVFIPNISKVNSSVNVTTDKALKQTIDAQTILYKTQKGGNPDAEKLKEDGYITEDQFKAYEEMQKEKNESSDDKKTNK